MIGDSFSLGILNNFKYGKVITYYHLYYYFNSDYDIANNSKQVIRDNVILKEAILQNDLIIIEANEASLKDIGFGFIEAGIEVLNNEN